VKCHADAKSAVFDVVVEVSSDYASGVERKPNLYSLVQGECNVELRVFDVMRHICGAARDADAVLCASSIKALAP
jgi:hypothetical protein